MVLGIYVHPSYHDRCSPVMTFRALSSLRSYVFDCSFLWWFSSSPKVRVLAVVFSLYLHAWHIVDLQWIIIEWKQTVLSITHRQRSLVKKVSTEQEYPTVGGWWVQTYQTQLNHTHFGPTNSVIWRTDLAERRNTLNGTSLKLFFFKDSSVQCDSSFYSFATLYLVIVKNKVLSHAQSVQDKILPEALVTLPLTFIAGDNVLGWPQSSLGFFRKILKSTQYIIPVPLKTINQHRCHQNTHWGWH